MLAALSVRRRLLVRDLDGEHFWVRVATLGRKRVVSSLFKLGFEMVLDAVGTCAHTMRRMMMLYGLLLQLCRVLVQDTFPLVVALSHHLRLVVPNMCSLIESLPLLFPLISGGWGCVATRSVADTITLRLLVLVEARILSLACVIFKND